MSVHTIRELLAAYFHDTDPERLPILADAYEDAGKLEPAMWLRGCRITVNRTRKTRVLFPGAHCDFLSKHRTERAAKSHLASLVVVHLTMLCVRCRRYVSKECDICQGTGWGLKP